jgi:hypothetical protein
MTYGTWEKSFVEASFGFIDLNLAEVWFWPLGLEL